MLQRSSASSSEDLVDAVLQGRDRLVCEALGNDTLQASVRREVLVEYLLERGATGADIVVKDLKSRPLPPEELRHVFVAAAEAGVTKVVRAVLRSDGAAVNAVTLRNAFEAAVRNNRPHIISILGDTTSIPVEVKMAAVNPSLFQRLEGPIDEGSARGEMGLVETQIVKAWRDKKAERSGNHGKSISKKEIARQEVFARYDRQIEEASKTIRSANSDSKEHIVEMCTRELLRQRDRDLFELDRSRESHYTVKGGYNRTQCRATNPQGLHDKRSVAELVEALYERQQRGEPVSWNHLIRAISREWRGWKSDFTQEQLSQHIRRIHPGGKTISGQEFAKWDKDSTIAPYRQTVAIICEAFGLSLIHELMMWRIARGGGAIDFKKLKEKHSHLSAEHSTSSERAKLVGNLVDVSGVPSNRLEELLQVQQLWHWKYGARIEDLAMCKKFVELTNPEALQPQPMREAHREVNDVLVGILSARPTSIVEAVTRAQAARHPGGVCFLLLTGRYGLKQVSACELSQRLGVSEDTIHRMRSTRANRGGHITEEQAHVVADVVQGLPKQMRDALTMMERYEREFMVDTLTGVRNPVALWHQFVSGELSHVGEILKLTRIRRGHRQLPNTSDFELGKSQIGIRLANKLADYLGFIGDAHRGVRREFVLRAMGLGATTTPEDVLDTIISGQVSRLGGLRTMLDLSGRTRGQLAQVMGIKKTAVMTWVRTDFNGGISRMGWIRTLATELGMPHRADDMVAVFGPKRREIKTQGAQD